MDQFFSPTTHSDISTRVQSVIDQLGRTLLELRVDTLYSGSGERQSDDTTIELVNTSKLLRRIRSPWYPASRTALARSFDSANSEKALRLINCV